MELGLGNVGFGSEFVHSVARQPFSLLHADWVSNVNKLRRTGFQGMCIDTEDTYTKIFKRLRDENFIP